MLTHYLFEEFSDETKRAQLLDGLQMPLKAGSNFDSLHWARVAAVVLDSFVQLVAFDDPDAHPQCPSFRPDLNFPSGVVYTDSQQRFFPDYDRYHQHLHRAGENTAVLAPYGSNQSDQVNTKRLSFLWFNNAPPSQNNNMGHSEGLIPAPFYCIQGINHPMYTGTSAMWFPFTQVPEVATFLTAFYHGRIGDSTQKVHLRPYDIVKYKHRTHETDDVFHGVILQSYVRLSSANTSSWVQNLSPGDAKTTISSIVSKSSNSRTPMAMFVVWRLYDKDLLNAMSDDDDEKSIPTRMSKTDPKSVAASHSIDNIVHTHILKKMDPSEVLKSFGAKSQSNRNVSHVNVKPGIGAKGRLTFTESLTKVTVSRSTQLEKSLQDSGAWDALDEWFDKQVQFLRKAAVHNQDHSSFTEWMLKDAKGSFPISDCLSLRHQVGAASCLNTPLDCKILRERNRMRPPSALQPALAAIERTVTPSPAKPEGSARSRSPAPMSSDDGSDAEESIADDGSSGGDSGTESSAEPRPRKRAKLEDSSTPPSARGTYKCGVCNTAGHNRNTCPTRKDAVTNNDNGSENHLKRKQDLDRKPGDNAQRTARDLIARLASLSGDPADNPFAGVVLAALGNETGGRALEAAISRVWGEIQAKDVALSELLLKQHDDDATPSDSLEVLVNRVAAEPPIAKSQCVFLWYPDGKCPQKQSAINIEAGEENVSLKASKAAADNRHSMLQEELTSIVKVSMDVVQLRVSCRIPHGSHLRIVHSFC